MDSTSSTLFALIAVVYMPMFREAAKKVPPLVARQPRGGGGGQLRKKITFYSNKNLTLTKIFVTRLWYTNLPVIKS